MKKNLLNIIILALLVINLILSAVMAFSVLPASSKTNEMVTKVCAALDLELESQKTGDEEQNYKIEDMETIPVGEEEMTISLKKSADSDTQHYVVLKVGLVVNNKHEDYSKYLESLTTKESLIQDSINSVVGSFTIDELRSNPEGVQEAVLQELQRLFDSDFIVKVTFSKMLYQ